MRRPAQSNPIFAGLAALAALASPASAATVTNVRIATHGDFVRVVVDLDTQVPFAIADDGSIELKGAEGENAVLNATPSQAPLKRVILSPGANGGARMKFETTFATTSKAFELKPDKDGGNRIVVDLYPKSQTPPAKAEAPATAALSPIPPAMSADAPPAEQSAAAVATVPAGTTSAVDPAPARSDTVSNPMAAVPGMPPELAPATPVASQFPPAAASIAAPGIAAVQVAAMTQISASPAMPVDTRSGSGFSDETLRAERALDRGDAKDACNRADNVLRANPNDLRALVVLGGCRLAQRDAIGAKGAYVLALQADPTFDRARVGLATADDMLADHAGARAELSRVLGHEIPQEDLKRLIQAFKELPPSGQNH